MRTPSAGREEIKSAYRWLARKARRATGNLRAPETGEEGCVRCVSGAALWRRGSDRTPEACENALAGKPKSRRGRVVVFECGEVSATIVNACTGRGAAAVPLRSGGGRWTRGRRGAWDGYTDAARR